MSNDKVKTAKLQQVIRKVLEAHGRLEKAEILTYVSTFLNVREKQIRASLHKSLKSMSDDNELQMQTSGRLLNILENLKQKMIL